MDENLCFLLELELELFVLKHCPLESNNVFMMSKLMLILRRANDHSLENLHELRDFVVLDLPLRIVDADDVIGKLCIRLELAVTYVFLDKDARRAAPRTAKGLGPSARIRTRVECSPFDIYPRTYFEPMSLGTTATGVHGRRAGQRLNERMNDIGRLHASRCS